MTSEAKELRAEYLADAQDDLAGNEPGSFGCHELLDQRCLGGHGAGLESL